jgi:hypothetical protein
MSERINRNAKLPDALAPIWKALEIDLDQLARQGRFFEETWS